MEENQRLNAIDDERAQLYLEVMRLATELAASNEVCIMPATGVPATDD